MYDPTSNILAGLQPEAQLRAWWLVYVVRQAGVPLIVTSGRRSLAEQQRLVDAGRSRTLNSAHLSGRAFDIDISGMSRNDIPTSFWNVVGPWAEVNLGLVWGGRWHTIYDPGHFELP